jgi:hypothetical protein
MGEVSRIRAAPKMETGSGQDDRCLSPFSEPQSVHGDMADCHGTGEAGPADPLLPLSRIVVALTDHCGGAIESGSDSSMLCRLPFRGGHYGRA